MPDWWQLDELSALTEASLRTGPPPDQIISPARIFSVFQILRSREATAEILPRQGQGDVPPCQGSRDTPAEPGLSLLTSLLTTTKPPLSQ